MAERINKRKHWKLNLLLGVLAIVLLMVAIWGCWIIWGNCQLAKIQDQLHKEGYALTPKELAKRYPLIPDSENAAVIFRKVRKQINNTDDSMIDLKKVYIIGTAKYPVSGKPLPKNILDESKKFMALHTKAMKLLRTANKKPKCRIMVDFVNFNLSDLNNLRSYARKFMLSAVINTEEGNIDQAVADIADGLKFANHLKNEPMIITLLVKEACDAVMLQQVIELLKYHNLNDSQLLKLSGQIRNCENKGAFQRALSHNMAYIDLSYQESLKALSKSRWMEIAAYATGLKSPNKIMFYRFLKRFCEAAGKPFPQALKDAKVIDEKLRKLPPYYFSQKHFLSNTLRLFIREASISAEIRLILTMIAIKRYQMKYKILPKKLTDLVPGFMKSVPLDPFDGKPLRYKIIKGGFVVYSIGNDSTDDGGNVGERWFILKPGQDLGYKIKCPIPNNEK